MNRCASSRRVRLPLATVIAVAAGALAIIVPGPMRHSAAAGPPLHAAMPATLPPPPATRYSYTVTSVADTDDDSNDPPPATGPEDCEGCTLREAIDAADYNCSHDTGAPTTSTTITFAIGSGPQTIALGSNLPTIVCPIVLDGTTQPGYAGTPLITIDGAGLSPNLGDGLDIGYDSSSVGSTVRGLVFNQVYAGAGLQVCCDGNFTIQNNYFGTDYTGTLALPNSRGGLFVNDVRNTPGPTLIGGTTADARNVISGNGGPGLQLGISSRNTVEGNYIGTDVTGTVALPNTGDGIDLNPQDSTTTPNTVGGTAAGAGNLISGNGMDGISVYGAAPSGETIQGNLIGTQVNGSSALGNGVNGIELDTDGPDAIGGSAPGAANTIAFNGADGVAVDRGTGHSILSNSLHSNGPSGGDGGLGVNLVECGNCSPPTCFATSTSGPNNLEHCPVLTSDTSTSTSTTVKGTLTSLASTTFTIQLYASPACDPSGYGEAQTLLETASTTTSSGHKAAFSLTVSPPVPAGDVLTATATDPAGNTSELSPCLGPLKLSPAKGTAGSNLTVAGKGFLAGEAVQVWWNCSDSAVCGASGTMSLGTSTSTSTGAFSLTTTAPAAPAGTYWIGALGQSSNRFVLAQFSTVPRLTIRPASGLPGSTASVSGTGFGTTETVTILWNCAASSCSSTTVLATVTSSNGDVGPTAVTIPSAAAGTYAIGAKGASSKAFAKTSFTVT